MAGNIYTINFDSGIEKVKYSSNLTDFFEHEVTASGEKIGKITELFLMPIFKQGYILDTTNVELILSHNNVYTTMKDRVPITNVVFTSKYVGGGGSMTKQVDLTTLTGWANLSDGEHTITIKAKADGYRDSRASEGVQVTKGSTGETWVLNEMLDVFDGLPPTANISFISNGTQYSKISHTGGISASMLYDTTEVYSYEFQTWNNTAYRTLTFATAPTGDLLTWLQANGTKQGGVTSGYTVTIQVTYGSYTPIADLSGQAFYSLDDGTTWIDCIGNSRPEQIVLENVTQIKFKGVSTGDYDEYFELYNGTGDLSAIHKYSTSNFTTNNVEIMQTSTIKMRFFG